ncbi:hypothetical protein NQZ68_022045 [Dissostichus eleginoides]|nr:hypothetical protein NQZ68_022045 [Dissostichus eleginoides]
MSEFRRIMMSSFLMLLLHFTAADVKYYFPIVRVGDEVTLPFDNVIHDQVKCESTVWTFRDSRSSVRLFEDRQIHKEAKAKSDRLRVTENCSLVIKKVTEEDAGLYTCRQFNNSGAQQGPDSHVDLSVVTMTEHLDNDEMTLDCSVTRYGGCIHRVKWLLQGRAVVKDHRDIKTSQSLCSASVTFLTSHFSYTPRSKLFTCAVTDSDNVQTFSLQSSGEDAGKVTTVSTTWTTVRIRPAGETNNTASEDNQTEPEDNNEGTLLRLIMVSVGLAALIITVVTVNIWTRAKESTAVKHHLLIFYRRKQENHEIIGTFLMTENT